MNGGRATPPVRPTLLQVLRSAHWRLGVAAVAVAGVVLGTVSFLSLRGAVDRHLTLVARSVAYTAEAAAVFGDEAAAQEVLLLIAEREKLREARILDSQGRVLARFRAPEGPALRAAMADLAALLFAPQAGAPIILEARRIGSVEVRGDGLPYLSYLAQALAAILLCMAAIAASVARLSRRIAQEIVRPLDRLARLTHTAREQRALGVRAPAAEVHEIHELGQDINALLAEIESREAGLIASRDKLRNANASLAHIAFHDQLTGLPNRARFLELAGQALRERGSDRVALLYLDADRFKSINDRHGHAAGDSVLVELAARIRAGVGERGVAARLGGDEFAVLLHRVGPAHEALAVADQLADALRAPLVSPAFGPLDLGASIGIAFAPDHADSLDELLAAADSAMYRVKAARTRGVGQPDHDPTVQSPAACRAGATIK